MEFRQTKKEILEAVFTPMEILRQTPYTKKPEYSHLQEEPREIYLSSAFWKHHWMWQTIKDAVVGTYNGTQFLFATDYALAIKHGIRSVAQMKKEKKRFDKLTYDMEYLNIMAGGSADQFYTYELVSKAQTVKKAWFPMSTQDFIQKKRTWFGDIKKTPGEIRVVSIDIAMSTSTDKTKNDLSVIKCIRAIKEGEKYKRQEVYTECIEGTDIDTQAIKVRRIFNDFRADYIVFDARTFGLNFVDSMAKVLYDEERDVEYTPIKCFNIDNLASRCQNPDASPVMWGFMGNAELNNNMHIAMLDALTSNKYQMLISHISCKEEYLEDREEYNNANMEQKSILELPYLYSDLTLNEMINLSKKFIQGDKIKLVEPPDGLKDKYVASAMGNYFIQDLESNLTKRDKNVGDVRQLIRVRPPVIKSRGIIGRNN